MLTYLHLGGVGGSFGWSELHLECVYRQITFVVHDYICSLALKPNVPKTVSKYNKLHKLKNIIFYDIKGISIKNGNLYSSQIFRRISNIFAGNDFVLFLASRCHFPNP